jgi:hypothetical protein
MSIETIMHHVISHIQEAEIREISLQLSWIQRDLLIALHSDIIEAATWQGLEKLSSDGLAPCCVVENLHSHVQRRHSGGVCGQGL